MEVDVINQAGKKLEKIELSPVIFAAKPNPSLLHEVARMYQANQRRGTASTKSRGEVSGAGRKPWRQKGTGRARAGSIRSPLWRKGGIIFGPKPRDWSYAMPKKKLKIALMQALADKLGSGGVIVVDKIELASPKTKEMAKILKDLKIDGNTALVSEGINGNLKRAGRNISNLRLISARELNAYDVLLCNKIIFTKAALDAIEGRFKSGTS